VSERKRAATIAPTGRLTLHEPDGRSTVGRLRRRILWTRPQVMLGVRRRPAFFE
jgi:hypothetical protein